MHHPSDSFRGASSNLLIDASIVPWDSAIYQFPIAAIQNIQILNQNVSAHDWTDFDAWLNAHHCQMVSCRLNHNKLKESLFLESYGFRFIEMLLHPVLERLESVAIPDQGLSVTPATPSDLDGILMIAESAFTNERFYIDPRLPRNYSHQRYGRWARSALDHPQQKLLKIVDNDTLVAFFVVEEVDSQSAYWHLTAVSPIHHGKGYGYRTWLSVLRHHQKTGLRRVSTSISARNSAVLNLYSKLNFRFEHPEMTFHWIRGEA